MIRFAADENLNADLIRAWLRRQPDLDILSVRQAGLSGADDPAVLDWAARERRVLLTHDVNTLLRHAYARVRADQPMPGVFAIPSDASFATVIEDLILISACSRQEEWEGQVRYLPF